MKHEQRHQMRTHGRRQVRFVGIGLAVFGVLGACAELDDETLRTLEVENEAAVGITWEAYRDAAQTTTFGGEEYLVAEGDLWFSSEEALRTHYDTQVAHDVSKAVIAQEHSSCTPGPCNDARIPREKQLDITYCVADSDTLFNFGTRRDEIISAMATATREWERVANVQFRYVPHGRCGLTSRDPDVFHNDHVEFAVIGQEGPTGACASNKYLWDDYYAGISCSLPGMFLVSGYSEFLDGTATFGTNNAPMAIEYLLNHELGHMLGFMHEYPFGHGVDSARDLVGERITDVEDPDSVMNYSDMLRTGLSAGDAEGARIIYGARGETAVATVGREIDAKRYQVGSRRVDFFAFINAFGGGLDVTGTSPRPVNYDTALTIECSGAPPAQAHTRGAGSGAPQWLNPAAEGDLTLTCPWFALSFGSKAVGMVSNLR